MLLWSAHISLPWLHMLRALGLYIHANTRPHRKCGDLEIHTARSIGGTIVVLPPSDAEGDSTFNTILSGPRT